ncbi:pancreatic triacylglycerol lipase-like isoform X2 [Anthonomus grandis grandis]|uniref:pancreatic triacylglycerol lipase-like isoform X2 n=1 Tax=Anthonomus grandis grandis TaxID=2921223 RepID=UPI002165277D|nr:pancreatic triacylglycerol lipase-like isoform X2 [Anthonomus grandis grandis]
MRIHYLVFLLVISYESFQLNTTTGKSSTYENSTEALLDQTPEGGIFKECYDELGCLEADQSWFHNQYRPVNLKPSKREIVKTQFVFIRKNLCSDEVTFDLDFKVVTTTKESLKSAKFKNGVFLFILIHDFTSNGYTGWIKHISNVLKLRTKKCNIISVDWGAGAQPPFDQAVANARLVALEIVHFLKFLRKHNDIVMDEVHLIGHGLGAHIAGYVGKDHQARKITGLDPTGPRFSGMPIHVKLDATDAKYVEILHTDAMDYNSQGTRELEGHADFFINNANIQPGCGEAQSKYDLLSITRGMLKEGEIMPGCSHKRAFKYYIESLEVEDCTFLGIKCQSYSDFKQGKCTSCGKKGRDCRTFGLVTYPTENRGSYFLQTDESRPFCLFQYRITIVLQKSKSSYYGFFEFIMIDKYHTVTKSAMAEARQFQDGVNSFVFYAKAPEMMKIKEVKIGWKEKTIRFCLFRCYWWVNVKKVSLRSLNSNKKNWKEMDFCPKSGFSIRSGEYIEFVAC